MRATAPGSASTHVGPSAESSARDSPAANSASTERASSTSSTGSERSSTPASRRLRSSSSAASLLEPVGLPERPAQLVARLGQVRLLVGELLGGAVQHQPERGQRRAQLVRGGAHERAPRLLLRREAPLHRRERAGEVADLVAVAVLDRRRVVRSALGHLERGGAQRAQAPHEPRRERDARHERHRERDERGGHERAPDHGLDPAEALERAPQVEHAACAVGLERDGDLRLPPARFAAQPRDEAVLPQAPAAPPGNDRVRRGPSRPACGRRRRTRTPRRRSGGAGW